METPVLTIPPLSAPGDRIDYMKVARLRAAIEANDLPIDARAIADKLAVTGLVPLPGGEPSADEAPASSQAAPLASEPRQEPGLLAEPRQEPGLLAEPRQARGLRSLEPRASDPPRRRTSRRPRKP
ncbi:MAG: flagellar biosynthesis anti-sigma factor FlgM [Polyangiaceae bacterium]